MIVKKQLRHFIFIGKITMNNLLQLKTSTFAFLLMCCTVALLFTEQLHASQWEQLNGPPGGIVTSIMNTPSGYILAGTKSGGVYRSINNGAKWARTPLTNVDVNAFLKEKTGNIIAATSDGIFHTFDEGNHWYRTNTGMTATTVYSLMKDKREYIFAGTSDGIYQSVDNGYTWSLLSGGMISIPVYAMASNDSDALFAGTGNGVFLSRDSGTTWTPNGLFGFGIRSLLVFSKSLYFAGTDTGLYSSGNYANVWVSSAFSGQRVNVLSTGPSGVMYAGTNAQGLWSSPDSGANWTPITTEAPSILSLNTSLSSLIEVGTVTGIYRSYNLGVEWIQSNTGLTATFINSLTSDSRGYIYAATVYQGLYRSADEGATWKELINAPNGTYQAIIATSSGTLIASHQVTGLYRSFDAGNSWSQVDSSLTSKSIQQLATHDNYIYAGSSNAGIFASNDEGTHWNSITPPIGSPEVTGLGVSPGGYLYAAMRNYGVFVSPNNGSSWVSRNTGLPLDIYVFGFDSSGNVYCASTSTSLSYRSNNDGVLWTPVATIGNLVTAIGTSSLGTIYATTKGGGVYKSTDGTSWNQSNTGLSTTNITSLTMSPSGQLYIGTEGSSVYKISYRLFGSISGKVFFDANRNRKFDANEIGTPNWMLVLRSIPTSALDTLLSTADTVVTDSNGNYSFNTLADGSYKLYEIQKHGWLQTYPSGRGFYGITIKNHEAIFSLTFGNTISHSFTGTTGANWSNPANWQDGRVPNDTDAVEIPVDVTYDQPDSSMIHSLRISGGGAIRFLHGAGRLRISNLIEIDSSSTFSLTNADSGTVVWCDGDWNNSGNFEAGQSTIVFGGTGLKTIVNSTSNSTVFSKLRGVSSQGNSQFYNLSIMGDSTFSDGNIVVSNLLTLSKPLYLSARDTLTMLSMNSDAIIDTGSVQEGTIERYIDTSASVTGEYRFESKKTTLQFSGSGSKPNSVMMTTYPNTEPDTTTFWFERMGGTVNTDSNTITLDSVHHFSKWVAGKPGSGFRKVTNSTSGYARANVARVYAINASGGSNFSARVALRYEESEINCTGCESQLELMRGPYIIDSVHTNWNLVSVPVEAESNDKDDLFPAPISQAFAFNGAYVANENLTFGTGYWMKFNQTNQVAIFGNDVDSTTLSLQQGWNLIGAISLPVDAANVTTSPGDLLGGSFFGYNNGYVVAAQLSPMHAYWIKATSSGELTLNGNGNVQGKISSTHNDLGTLNSLTIRDANGNEQTLLFGKGNFNLNKYDMPPIPPKGIFDARYISNRIVELSDNEKTKEIPITISSAQYPITLSWKNKQTNSFASLIVGGNKTSVVANGKITVNDPSALVVLRLSGVETTPKQFALHQNYPNPFNPTTTISFDIPKDEFVSLKVYNILGQQIVTLLENSEYKAGTYSLQVNTAGWSSGIYFYRIQAGEFAQTKKMILTK